MKKQTRIQTCIMCFCLLIISFSIVGQEAKPSLSKVRDDDYVWLHVDGAYIRKSPYCADPDGIWMGYGMARKSDMPTPTASQAEYFAQWCKNNHFNLVRIRWDVNNSDSGIIHRTINPYFKALKALQIYSILDCHSDMRDGWDANNPTGRCKTWLDNWLAIAQYYKDEPWIMGYELNNEPQINSASMCRDLYKKCIEKIRSVDQKHILILGCYNWSHARGSAATWETGLPADEQFRPDPPYNQVIFNFHEYPEVYGKDGSPMRPGYPVYTSIGKSNSITNDQIAHIQEIYKVPFMCTEFGVKANNNSPPTVDEARKHLQEIIEMCYGQADFWKDFTGLNKAYPARGTPKGAGFRSWIAWWDYNNVEDSYDLFRWCQYMDILSYAAEKQASPVPIVQSGIK